ncbi:ankyrin repeat-containing domain, PGG domain protein [Artemisia annua]|uniref:Ankyrin repeat-containing domain, PGG domain protein n=1 Tax=Artemisia annua TaxID=35608 RepID=A0A2U1KMZ3_ARTAN|nr:ankyrin repeat-containing domain, PGG domain protein [Artemisia annua]
MELSYCSPAYFGGMSRVNFPWSGALSEGQTVSKVNHPHLKPSSSTNQAFLAHLEPCSFRNSLWFDMLMFLQKFIVVNKADSGGTSRFRQHRSLKYLLKIPPFNIRTGCDRSLVISSFCGRRGFLRRRWRRLCHTSIKSSMTARQKKKSRENYLKIGVPLYEASIKCDWNAAKAILDENKNLQLLKCSITENGETALHVAASANGPKKVEQFVRNLVAEMKKEDLELVNNNQNTALYLAATAGNIETVKIMVEKNSVLPTIPGAGGTMMPVYVAALFGNYQVVKYLYDKSHGLCDEGWTDTNRGWLLEKCVESDMFDIAIDIVNMYPALGRSSTLLGMLARKPQAFHDKKSNIIERTIKLGDYLYSSVFATHQPSQNKQSEPRSESVPKHSAQPTPSPNKKDNMIARTFKSEGQRIQIKKSASSGRVAETILLQCIYEHLKKLEISFQHVNEVPQLEILISEHLVKMHLETQNIIKQDNKAPQELQKLISEFLVKMHDGTQDIIRGEAGKDPQKLKDFIFYQTYDMRRRASSKDTRKDNIKESHSSPVLFVAAEMGNTKFLVELIRRYPDLIWKVNDDNQSMFHVAVKHRHAGIYNLLYEIGAMKDMITPLKDDNDNNMLHLVGKIVNRKQLENVSVGALEMPLELLWFQEVESVIPPSYREQRNFDGLTPHELFTKEHKNMVTQGEKWMREMATQCIVVAALIATVAFAAAFTVPGGYDQNNGIPIFYSKTTYKVFVVVDAISLFSSIASILHMFLTVFTSPYAVPL